MKNSRVILPLILLCAIYTFSQKLPPFTVSENSIIGSYFAFLVDVGVYTATKIGDDYLFDVFLFNMDSDSIFTDTLFFGFNGIHTIRIKKISFKRGEFEYLFIDSFQNDTVTNWELLGDKFDSLQISDSLISVTLFKESAFLRLQINKKVSIKRDDTINIVLDSLPQLSDVHLLTPINRSSGFSSEIKCKKTLYFLSDKKQFFSGEGVNRRVFNLSGQKQSANKCSNIYISKFR